MIVRSFVCREMVEVVTSYLEGTMSRRDRKRFERHIAGCDACTAYLAQMRATIRLTGTVTIDEIPADVHDDMLTVFRAWKEGR